MDTGRLVGIVGRLISEDEKLSVQFKLQAVLNSLSNLASSPTDPSFQLSAKAAFDALSESVRQLSYETDPTFSSYVDALNGQKYFSETLMIEISQAMANNTMTPAVARDLVQRLYSERQTYLDFLKSFSASAHGLNISADEVKKGESQIGFRIPRDTFGNELKGWTAELNELRSIIRPFSEMATGGAEPIQIGEISTTDPIIFLILNPVTIAMIAKAVSWAIDQWEKVERIRKLRAETAAISSELGGGMDEIVVQFEGKIEAIVNKAIKDHANELVPEKDGAGRHNEVRTDLSRALQSLVARIERGMTIELKFLPAVNADDPDGKINAAMEDIKEVVPKLAFPSPSKAPLISLPKARDDESSENRKPTTKN